MLSRIQAMGWHGIVDPGQSGCLFRIVGSQAQQYSVSRATDHDLMAMLQTLLAERFRLALHHEAKPIEAYVLEVGRMDLSWKAVMVAIRRLTTGGDSFQ